MATNWRNAAEQKPELDGFYWVRLESGPEQYLARYRNQVFFIVRVSGETLEQELALNVVEWQPLNNDLGLTAMERQACSLLVDFWNLYVKLPGFDSDDLRVVRDSIHAIQSIMAFRVAKRFDPDIWK